MKNSVKRMIRNENGKVLILVLVLLVIGGLTLTPLLGLMSAGLVSGQVYEKKTNELYAADAGVEDAIWKLQHELELPSPCSAIGWEYPDDGDPPFEFELNGKNVQVTIEYLEHDGEGGFKITSTAASDNSSSTTVVSFAEATYVEGTIEHDYKAEDGEIMDEISGNTTVYAEGNLTVTDNIQDSAIVYVEGDLEVGGNIEGDSVEVLVKGDLIMSGFGNIEDTAIVCVVGDLYIGHCSEDGVEVYVEGNLIGTGSNNGIENSAKVCVEKNITVDKIEGGPTVCCNGTLTANNIEEGAIIHAAGYEPFYECPMCCEGECRICCECPLVFTTGEGSWQGWAVKTYSINP